MKEWKEYKFSDFALVNPSVKIAKGEDVSFVEMKDLADGKRFCEPSQKRMLGGGSRFQSGDTLFARITPCLENGKICQVRNLDKNVGFGSTEFHVFRGKAGVSDSDFVFYLSRWSEVRSHAEMNFDGTSGRQRVPKQAFDDLFLNLPPLPEQRAIATILSSLDDKIDLLHRQNATLEAMAEAVFRQWFVVEAREEWGEGTLDDILSVKGGTTPSTNVSEYWDGNISWTSPRDITKLDGIYLFETERRITESGLSKVSSGLLPKGTLLMTSRAPVGVLAFAEIPLAINQGYIAIIDDKGVSKEFIYLWLKSNMDSVHSYANGSTFQEISKSTFKTLEVLIPPVELRKNFQTLVNPIFAKIKSNQIQIRTLTTLRDTLLPKLMSGEVRVKM
ncbi:MAG: restriction endonuclease subunit S [Saprospiraceae bacterium]|nr:restriction endonuclease subunit S [Saprospiraceae bacterium]